MCIYIYTYIYIYTFTYIYIYILSYTYIIYYTIVYTIPIIYVYIYIYILHILYMLIWLWSQLPVFVAVLAPNARLIILFIFLVALFRSGLISGGTIRNDCCAGKVSSFLTTTTTTTTTATCSQVSRCCLRLCLCEHQLGIDQIFQVGVSENSVPLNPMVNDHCPY